MPENDSPPVRVKVLSERLLAFRDSDGRLGLIDEFCAHRGVSLWFGRNEEKGLRCPYHGWKYDVTGQCIDVPSEPEESGFCKKIKLKSYPLIERGGVLWTYMGPKDQTPPLPEWEFASRPGPAALRLQAGAGIELAAGHGGRHQFKPRVIPASRRPQFRPAVQGRQGQPVQYRRLAAGVRSRRKRRAASTSARAAMPRTISYYWRITQWVMPSFTMIAPRGNHSVHGHFWIPIDDENCWTWSFDYHPIRNLTDAEVAAMRDGKGIHVEVHPRHVPIDRQQGQ